MSKQLAISSVFAVFAMSAMALTVTADHSAHVIGEPLVASATDLPSLMVPELPFLSGR